MPSHSQVQSTAVPVPAPLATVWPVEVVIVTDHGCAWDRRARNRTDASAGSARGSKIFGPPSARAVAAIDPSFAYRALPGHSVRPVSRWPDTASNSTGTPFG